MNLEICLCCAFYAVTFLFSSFLGGVMFWILDGEIFEKREFFYFLSII